MPPSRVIVGKMLLPPSFSPPSLLGHVRLLTRKSGLYSVSNKIEGGSLREMSGDIIFLWMGNSDVALFATIAGNFSILFSTLLLLTMRHPKNAD